MHDILCSALYSLHYMKCIPCSAFYAVYSMTCILCIELYGLYSIVFHLCYSWNVSCSIQSAFNHSRHYSPCLLFICILVYRSRSIHFTLWIMFCTLCSVHFLICIYSFASHYFDLISLYSMNIVIICNFAFHFIHIMQDISLYAFQPMHISSYYMHHSIHI